MSARQALSTPPCLYLQRPPPPHAPRHQPPPPPPFPRLCCCCTTAGLHVQLFIKKKKRRRDCSLTTRRMCLWPLACGMWTCWAAGRKDGKATGNVRQWAPRAVAAVPPPSVVTEPYRGARTEVRPPDSDGSARAGVGVGPSSRAVALAATILATATPYRFHQFHAAAVAPRACEMRCGTRHVCARAP